VTFFDGSTAIGAPQALAAGSAAITTTTLAAGVHNITATYSGDTHFAAGTSAVQVQYVLNFLVAVGSGNGSGQTVEPGHTAVFAFNLLPAAGPISYPVTLSATGLPPGATATFAPNPVMVSESPSSFTMSIQVPASAALLHHRSFFGSTIALGLLLPFACRSFRRRALWLCFALFISMVGIGGITGCGTGGESQQTYTIGVIATAPAGITGGPQQHFATVTLTVK
jgi:hypothetical protein